MDSDNAPCFWLIKVRIVPKLHWSPTVRSSAGGILRVSRRENVFSVAVISRPIVVHVSRYLVEQSTIVTTSQSISFTTDDGLRLSRPGTIVQAMVVASNIQGVSGMLGEGAAEQASVANWLASGVRMAEDGADLDALNAALRITSYVAGSRLSAADVVVLHAARAQVSVESP